MAYFLIFFSWFLFTLYLLKFQITQKKYVYFNSAILVFFVFLLYYTYPVLFNLFKGNSYKTFYRLNNLYITDMENNFLSMHIFVGSLGFFISSFFFNKKLTFIDKECSKYEIISYLLIIIFFLFLQSIFFSSDMTNSSRSASYQFIASQSFQFRILNKFINATYLFVELIFYYKFFQYFKYRINIIKLFFIFFIIYNIFTFSFFDQRSELFMKIAIVIISFHTFVRRFSNLQLILLVVSSIFLLAIWGNLREMENLTYNIDFFPNIGEFDMIYANFIDLYRVPPDDFSLKLKLYDFYSFIPSPLLWFDKLSLPYYFMENYHLDYFQKGGGYGFGILTESLYGYGLVETFFKMIILSTFLNYVFIYYSNSKKNIHEIFYVILFVTSPLSIRVTSFHFLNDVIQFGIFIFILLILTKSILRILR